MVPTDGWVLGAIGVLGVATLQLVLGTWRDLGPLTLASGGILAILALPEPPPAVWAGLSAASLVAAIAWARGAPRGIGHPSMSAVVLGLTLSTGALCAASPSATLRAAGATGVGAVGLLAAAVALRSPGDRHRPVRWVGEIRVQPPGEQAR